MTTIVFDTKPHMHKILAGKSKEWNKIVQTTPLPFLVKRPRACTLVVSLERPNASHYLYANGVYLSEYVE